MKTEPETRVRIRRLSPPVDVHAALARDVLEGFRGDPKMLPPKYFYDARGSELFVEITQTDEYYLTRTESALLDAHARSLLEATRPEELFEIGSGASHKTRVLLEALHAVGGNRYVALEVSEDALRDAARALTERYDWLEVEGLIGDFHTDLARIESGPRRLMCFLGSTLGNLIRSERDPFFAAVARVLQPDDAFLLGVDLVKSPAVLEAAYNDAAGVTARFNKNVLHVLNRELDGDVPVEAFEHVSTYDREERRIVSRLRATRDVDARLNDLDLNVHFDAGEELFTEVSTKFERDTLEAELNEAGLRITRWIEAEDHAYGLALIQRA